jgi:HPt (histidine-containing phosphotransfer) domain-containing protein
MNFLWDLVMENVEFMQNVLRQFMKQFPGEMESLKEAVAVSDNKRVAALSHHIQSTVSVLGKKTPFFEQLEKLEKTALNRGTSQQLTTALNSLLEHKQLLLRDIDRLTKAELE